MVHLIQSPQFTHGESDAQRRQGNYPKFHPKLGTEKDQSPVILTISSTQPCCPGIWAQLY